MSPFCLPVLCSFTYSHRSASFKGVGLLIADRVPGSVVPTALDLRCRGHFRLPFPVLTQEQKKEWLPMVRITDCSSMLGSFSPSRRCSPFRLGICPVSQRKLGFLRELYLYLLFKYLFPFYMYSHICIVMLPICRVSL